MALETKALIIGMAEYAAAVKNRVMYNYAMKLAGSDGLTILPYEEAKAELERIRAEDD
jgi:hypothetical protein